MILPKGFTGLILLYWGFQTQLLWVAAPLALVVEAARFAPRKWDFKAADFNRFVDVSTIFLAAAFVIALTMDAQHALSRIMQWLPVIFFPLALAQAFSTAGNIPVRSFFLASRRKKKQPAVPDKRTLDIAPLFGIACLCGAGAGRPGDPWFFPACFAFGAWGLWQVRPKRYPAVLWLVLVLSAGALGFAGQKGFYQVRIRLQHWLVEYYAGLMNFDPFKTTTAMGEIGELKLSGRIMFRVSFNPEPTSLPVYLHGATYDRFSHATWFSSHRFERVSRSGPDNAFLLRPGPLPEQAMTFYLSPKKKDLLFLPGGAHRLGSIKSGTIERNPVSAVRISNGPALLRGVALYDPDQAAEALPGPRDLLIPPREAPHIQTVSQTLKLDGLSPARVVRRVEAHFLEHFSYSLDLAGRGWSATPLANFLLRTQKGHCELFATATVLLLRSAGVPARYATGFVAHEKSATGPMILVRQQDAHAWVKAWINNQWVQVDTTPPGFIQADRTAMGNTLVRDLVDFIGFQLSRFRHETGPRLLDQYGLWLILPLVLILAYRLRFNKKVRQTRDRKKSRARRIKQAEKQGIAKVEEKLKEMGFQRLDHETWHAWHCRIQNGIMPLNIDLPLSDLIRLENRLRFSRDGLTGRELDAYGDMVNALLEKLTHHRPPAGP